MKTIRFGVCSLGFIVCIQRNSRVIEEYIFDSMEGGDKWEARLIQ